MIAIFTLAGTEEPVYVVARNVAAFYRVRDRTAIAFAAMGSDNECMEIHVNESLSDVSRCLRDALRT